MAAQTVFRRVPVLGDREGFVYSCQTDRSRAQQCEERTGHVLEVIDKIIRCRLCPAEWKNEGF